MKIGKPRKITETYIMSNIKTGVANYVNWDLVVQLAADNWGSMIHVVIKI